MEKHIGDLMRIVRCTNYFRTQKMADSGITESNAPIFFASTGHLVFPRNSWLPSFTRIKASLPDTWLLWNPTAISTGSRIRKTGGSKKLYLTAKAEELLPRIREVFQEWNQILYDGFSDEEILLLSFHAAQALFECGTGSWTSGTSGGTLPGSGTGPSCRFQKGDRYMKRLAIYLHPYLGRIGLGFTIKFMGTLLDLMIPWMLSTIIDEVIPTGEFQRVLLWGCMMLLCSAAVFAFNVIPNRMASAVARDVTEEVRRDLYQKATLLSCAQMDRITIPSVISRLTTDTYNLHRMIGMMQRLGVRAPILLLGGLIVTMSMETQAWRRPACHAAVYGAYHLADPAQRNPMYSVTQKKVDRMIQVVRESVTGIRIIKALSKTDYESGRFDKISKDLSDQEQTASITMATTNPLMNLYLNSGLVIVILLGAYMVYSGTTQIGRIIAFQSYFTIILNAVISISRMFVIYSKGSASADRIQEILELPEELQTIPGDPEKDPKAAPDEFLAFDHVSFSYLGQKDNLTNISFTLKRGESLGIIGATGSGKSTIVHLLLRLYDVTAGQIRLNGTDIRKIPTEILHQAFGIVFQSMFFLPIP